MTTQKMRSVLKEVLKEIKPSVEERRKFNRISEEILELTNEIARKFRGYAIIAGSLTRDTWLPKKNEFDVFIVFPKDLPEETLEKYGLEIGKKVIDSMNGTWVVEYAQHPYVRGSIGDVDIDIVPCYRVNSGEEIRSAVDRTPFHVDYLDKNLPRPLSDDVRLLKAFLRAHDIYGADTKTEGFSGYICELLVINYGKFHSVLNAVKNWKPKELIDIKGYWEEKDYKKLRKKFKDEVLIIIDPVDKNRNAAAAISPESFYKFKKITRDFLKNPQKELFRKKTFKPLAQKELEVLLNKRRTELLMLKFGKPNVVPDILWPQLRKATGRLDDILSEYEFRVHRSDFWSDEKKLCTILFEMEVNQLPSINEKIGPHIWKETNSKNFIEKYKEVAINGPYIRNNRWRVEVKRHWKSAVGKLRDTLSDEEKTLRSKGIPSYISNEIGEGFKILRNEEIGELLKNKELGIFLRKYFEKEVLDI
ncbi:MAG: CCA tRNA nucleotidyltransferase [Candidatus Aenigmarchaeota archaeon]|nr:CCA tRNA nucleotidyltransferase [Candidatus Aenigmarchaeota archaeon]